MKASVILLVMALCTANVALCEEVDVYRPQEFAGDARLRQQVNITALGWTLRDLLARLSEDSRVALRASP